MGSGGSTSLLPPGKLVDVRDYLSTIEFGKADLRHLGILHLPNHIEQYQNKTVWVLYGQASRAISTG